MDFNTYNLISFKGSKTITRAYSNSFSLAVSMLPSEIRTGIYSIYGFVRLADEIVDSFHDYDKTTLLDRFCEETDYALKHGISINPVIHCFQLTVKKYSIGAHLIDAFLSSMRKDLDTINYNKEEYYRYIFGSADVVGLMCLKVFVEGNEIEYERLKSPAMSLGSAFQKVNFLRDIKNDYEKLNRKYFPGVDLNSFTQHDKDLIIAEIKSDFKNAYQGIKALPSSVRLSVFTAYVYYSKLLGKLERTPPADIMQARISIPHHKKLSILAFSYFRFKLRFI